MTEAVAVYQETNSERSTLKNSSYHKKNGIATSKLGNRRMTNKEIEEKHGECISCNLTMTFAQFRALPNDLQVEFLNNLQDKYDISVKHIGRELFGLKDDDALRSHLQLRKIWKSCNPDKARAKTGLLKFREDIVEAKKRAQQNKVIDIRSIMPKSEDIPKFMNWDDFKALSPDEKVVFINRLLDEYQVGCFTIDKELFCSSYPKVHENLKKAGVYDHIHVPFRGGKACQGPEYKAKVQRFHDDIQAWRGEPITLEAPPVIEVAEVTGATDVKADAKDVAAVEQPASEEVVKITAEPESETAEIVEDANNTNDTDDTDDADDICDPKDFWHGDEFFPTTATSGYQFNPGIGLNEEQESEQKSEEDPMKYHDSSFTASYISRGLDTDEFYALAMLFRNKRVKVEITVTEV